MYMYPGLCWVRNHLFGVGLPRVGLLLQVRSAIIDERMHSKSLPWYDDWLMVLCGLQGDCCACQTLLGEPHDACVLQISAASLFFCFL
jgi:hypothetical protein